MLSRAEQKATNLIWDIRNTSDSDVSFFSCIFVIPLIERVSVVCTWPDKRAHLSSRNMPGIHSDPCKTVHTHLTPCAVQIKVGRGGRKPKPLGYELSTQSQNEPVIYKCKFTLTWMKKPGKKGMVSWSLGCSCLPHQYNLISLCQTCPSSIAFRQQFTLFPCFRLPAPLMLLDPFLKLPAQKLAMFSKKSKHCWEATSLPPLQLQQCIPASPAYAHLSPPPSPKRVFASQKNH